MSYEKDLLENKNYIHNYKDTELENLIITLKDIFSRKLFQYFGTFSHNNIFRKTLSLLSGLFDFLEDDNGFSRLFFDIINKNLTDKQINDLIRKPYYDMLELSIESKKLFNKEEIDKVDNIIFNIIKISINKYGVQRENN